MISEDNYKIACDLKFNFTFSQSIPVSVNFGVNMIKCILLLPANSTAFLANFHIERFLFDIFSRFNIYIYHHASFQAGDETGGGVGCGG